MHKKIKDLIPDWFKPESYSINKDFDLLDYFHNLRIRYLMTMYIPEDKSFTKEIKKASNFELIQINDLIQDFKDIVKTAPLVKMNIDERKRFFENEYWSKGDEHLRPAVKSLNLYRDSIKPLSWGELNCIGSEMRYVLENESSEKEKELYKLINELPESDQTDQEIIKHIENYKTKKAKYKKQNIADLLNEPLFLHLTGDASIMGEKALIAFNLKSPDHVLLDDFKQFLKAIRKLKHLQYRKGKEVSMANAQAWKQFKVIEYFDLILWFAINDIKVTDHQMGEILFNGNQRDPVDIIRNSTRVYVDELRNPDFFEKLYWQLWINRDTYLKVG